MKTCGRCGVEKPLDDFYSHPKTKDGRDYRCKPCVKEYRNGRYQNTSLSIRRATLLRNQYGLTAEKYDEMMEAQGGRCAVCRQVPIRFVIDHDHNCCPSSKSCGACIRGLLCNNCNVALGHAKDDIQTLESMIAYLQLF